MASAPKFSIATSNPSISAYNFTACSGSSAETMHLGLSKSYSNRRSRSAFRPSTAITKHVTSPVSSPSPKVPCARAARHEGIVSFGNRMVSRTTLPCMACSMQSSMSFAQPRARAISIPATISAPTDNIAALLTRRFLSISCPVVAANVIAPPTSVEMMTFQSRSMHFPPWPRGIVSHGEARPAYSAGRRVQAPRHSLSLRDWTSLRCGSPRPLD